MKWYQFVALTALAVQLGGTGTAADRAASGGEGGGLAKLPPVLRPTDPPDSGQVTLPRPPPAPPALKKIVPLAPVAEFSPLPAILLEDASLRKPIPVPVFSTPAAKPAPPRLPVGPEAAPSCQKQIGHWKESDARRALGEPTRHRPAFDEKKSVNGTIYAYTDPSRQHKELELDFDSKSGLLRTVFVVPRAPHLAGVPPTMERAGGSRRCRPRSEILLLYQSPPRCPGGFCRKCDQSWLVLMKKP